MKRHRLTRETAPAWDTVGPQVESDGEEAALQGRSRASCPYPLGGAWGHFRAAWLDGFDRGPWLSPSKRGTFRD